MTAAATVLGVVSPRGVDRANGVPHPETDTLDALVTAAAAGDAAALAAVLEHIREPVTRYCRARIGSRERNLFSADDVAQDALFAVMTSLPNYRRRTATPFLAYAYGIAAHKVADALRHASRSRSIPTDHVPELPHTDCGPEDLAVAADGDRRVHDLLDTLSPTEREVLTLRIVVGMSAGEVADIIDSTPGSVRVTQHRALRKLRTTLRDQEHP